MLSRFDPRWLILTAALLFSTGGAAIKATALSSWQVAGLRSAVAAVALLVMLPQARRRWNPGIVLVGSAYAATLILYVTANKLTTAANTIFLQSTAPLYILILGPWLLKERLRSRDLIYMAVLAAGMSLFFAGTAEPSSTAPNPLLGNLLAATAGPTWALAVVGLRWMGRQSGRREGDVVAAVVAGNVIAALFCLPAALPIAAMTSVDLGLILFLGVVQIGVAYACLTAGIRHVPALEVSLLLLVEPVLNPAWAWLFHGELPTRLAAIGGAIIVLATVVRTVRDRRSGGAG
jgi:drug/metabolite transporter (DMT)-like permease